MRYSILSSAAALIVAFSAILSLPAVAAGNGNSASDQNAGGPGVHQQKVAKSELIDDTPTTQAEMTKAKLIELAKNASYDNVH